MSSTAVGRIRVDGTAPSAPLHNLLSAPGVLLSEERWDGGVNVWGYTTDVPSLWDACSAGTYRVKDEGGMVASEGFDSFVIYVAQLCSTFGIATDLPGFARRADAVLEATQSYAIEKALAQGVPGLPDNKYLGDPDLVSLATNVSPIVGLSYLENAIGATGRRGMIHLTPAVAAQLDIDLSNNNAGGPLMSLSGNVIVIGGGYIGTDPDDEPSPDTTHDWIFATGPVQARVSEILSGPEEVSGMVDPETNEVIYRAEKLANVSWDGALQVGVLVDWVP